MELANSFYDLQATTIHGVPVSFDKYRGKVCLVMNTACNCGLALKNYELIKKIMSGHPEVEILLFPSKLNSLFDQEHKEKEKTIQKMKEAGVFDKSTVFEKTVANGGENEPLGWLARRAPGILGTVMIKWNFTKFLVSKSGKHVVRFSPNDDYDKLVKVLEEFLGHPK